MSKTKEGIEVKVGQVWQTEDMYDLRIHDILPSGRIYVQWLATPDIIDIVVVQYIDEQGWKLIQDV